MVVTADGWEFVRTGDDDGGVVAGRIATIGLDEGLHFLIFL